MDSIHTCIHQNLLLLTRVFPNLDMETKLQPGMFKRPSTKGMQSVFYSLMFIINPEYCKKCVPWPISFTSDNYKFRTSVIEFINKECSDFEVPTLLPSLLNKVDGEKYVKFVFNFVTYITQKVLTTKFGELTLQKPSAKRNYEENLSLLDDVIASSLSDFDEKILEHKNFVEKTDILLNSSVCELQTKLKEYQSERQSVYSDLKDALSYTNITEESAIDCVFSSYEDELMELKSNVEHLKETVTSKMERKEYLLRLMKLKQKLQSNVFDIETFKSYINENLAQQIQVPLPTLMSSLFTDRGDEIQLMNFLRYGNLVIQKQMQRVLKLSPSDQQLAIYQTVDSLSASTAKRLDVFRSLCAKFDSIAKDCQKKHSVVVQRAGDDSNNAWVDLFMALKSYDNYVPRLLLPAVEKPLLENFRTEGDTNPTLRIKRRLQLVGQKT